MAKMARATASAADTNTPGMNLKHVTPTKAEINWPPTKGHGWAIGLCDAANNNTDEAPREVIMSGVALSPRPELNRAVRKIPRNAAAAETIFSATLTGAEAWNSEAIIRFRAMDWLV